MERKNNLESFEPSLVSRSEDTSCYDAGPCAQIEENTWARVEMEFLFECSTRWLTSERNERVQISS